MAAKPAPAREQPLAPHLSGPLEKPWQLAYDALGVKLQQRIGKAVAKLATPPPTT